MKLAEDRHRQGLCSGVSLEVEKYAGVGRISPPLMIRLVYVPEANLISDAYADAETRLASAFTL